MRLFAYELMAHERYQQLTRGGPEHTRVHRALLHWAQVADAQDEAPRVTQGGSCSTVWQEWRRREMNVMGRALEIEMLRRQVEAKGIKVPR